MWVRNKLLKSEFGNPLSDQSGTLKTALLDYIKRCRPGDSEKHNMIALCFSMCREIGENHEAAACIQLKLIESQPWGERQLQSQGTGVWALLQYIRLLQAAAHDHHRSLSVVFVLRRKTCW